jgi:hypothetical protein
MSTETKTELELLSEQYELRIKLNELGEAAGVIQARLNQIGEELINRIKSNKDATSSTDTNT